MKPKESNPHYLAICELIAPDIPNDKGIPSAYAYRDYLDRLEVRD